MSRSKQGSYDGLGRRWRWRRRAAAIDGWLILGHYMQLRSLGVPAIFPLLTFDGGSVKLFDNSKCLDVVNGQDVDGAKLQIWDCSNNGNPNQQFYYTGDYRYEILIPSKTSVVLK